MKQEKSKEEIEKEVRGMFEGMTDEEFNKEMTEAGFEIVPNGNGEVIFTEEVLSFELRGDEQNIIEDIKNYIPSDREDILSWLCYFQNELNDYHKR